MDAPYDSTYLESIKKTMKRAIEDGFGSVIEGIQNAPPLYAASPSPEGRTRGVNFFVPYAEPPPTRMLSTFQSHLL